MFCAISFQGEARCFSVGCFFLVLVYCARVIKLILHITYLQGVMEGGGGGLGVRSVNQSVEPEANY